MTISPLAGKPAPKETADRPGPARTRILRAQARSRRPEPAGQLRHQRASRLAAARVVHRGPHPGHHPGDLRLPACPGHRRPALHGQGHACALRAGPAHRARSPGGQRRRDDHPARRRRHPDAGHLARHPGLQPRPHRASRRRHRHHAVAQPAGGRRLQVQPDQRRPGRHRRDRSGSRTGPTSCCATATPE